MDAYAAALRNATNINVSDTDLATVPPGVLLPGEDVNSTRDTPVTVLYWAWGDQELGPTAMVLAVGLGQGTLEQFLAAQF